MITEDMEQTTAEQETRSGKIADEVLAVVREAARAMETEVAAMLEVEKAYKQASDAATELKDSLEANRASILSFKKARDRAKQALSEVTKTAQAEAKANRDEELKEDRWKIEEMKVDNAKMKGKSISLNVRDKVKHEAEESAQRAFIAQRNAENAKKELMLADTEVKLAEKEMLLAFERVRNAREKDEAASKEIPKAENIAQRAMKVARTALENEINAKKTMDLMIKRLKALVDNETKNTRAAETADVTLGLQNDDENKEKMTDEGELVGGITGNIGSDSNIYSGKVKFLIASPADYTMVKKFQERLMKFKDFRIQSVYGSDVEGIQITVLVEQPVPLVGYINKMEFVERVSRISKKEIEVSLKSAC